jgi:protein SCO1/2
MTTSTAAVTTSPTEPAAPWKKWLFLVPVVLVLSGLAFNIFRPITVLPRITPAPGFSFTMQDGSRLTNEDLRGKFVLYNFTYTGCQAPECEQTTDVMQALQARLPELDMSEVDFRMVTVSFDPARDTPADLLRFAESYDADLQRWHFATGEPLQLKYALGGGFGVYYTETDEGNFEFDPMFVLVDGWGIMRAEYRTATPDVDRLVRHLDLLFEEARNSEGAARYAYEAAHLFLCYPR